MHNYRAEHECIRFRSVPHERETTVGFLPWTKACRKEGLGPGHYVHAAGHECSAGSLVVTSFCNAKFRLVSNVSLYSLACACQFGSDSEQGHRILAAAH